MKIESFGLAPLSVYKRQYCAKEMWLPLNTAARGSVSEAIDIVGDLRGSECRLLALRMDHNCCADCCERDRNGPKKHALHELAPWQKVAMCHRDARR